MRPRRLEVNGFTAFRDLQEVDFSELDLFVITGPTGAGKTSLLDAIALSLYGQVPRMGKHGLGQLVSHGKPEARVLLEFSVGGDDYRVSRRLPRKGAQQGRFERRAGDRWVDAVQRGGIRAMNEAILSLVKLDFESFCKAIVLPQGDFARFLKGDPGERRETLSALLGLKVYDRMGALARQRASELRIQGEQTRKILDEQFGDATPEALLAARAAVDTAAEAAGRAAEVLAEARDLDRTRGEAALQAQTVTTHSERFTGLAAELTGELENCRTVEAAKAEADADHARALAIVERTSAIFAQSQTRRTEVHKRTGTFEELARLIDAVERRITLDQRVDDAESKIGEASKLQENRASAVEQRTSDDAQARAAADMARDAEESARADSERLTGKHAELRRRLETAVAAAAVVDAARAGLAAAETAAGDAISAATSAATEQSVAEQVRDSLQREHAVAALASGLAPGDSCPVCHRPLVEHPSLEPDVEQRLVDAQEACASAGDAARRTQALTAEAQGRLTTARARGADAAGDLEKAVGQFGSRTELEDANDEADGAARGAAATLEGMTQARMTSEKAAQQAGSALAKAQAELEAANRERHLLQQSLDRAVADREGALELLRTRFGDAVPADAGMRLQKARTELVDADEAVETARSADDMARMDLATASDARRAAGDALATIDVRLGGLRIRTEGAVAELDRRDEAPVLANMPEPAEARDQRVSDLAAWCAVAGSVLRATGDTFGERAKACASEVVRLASTLDLAADNAATALKSLFGAERDAMSARVRAEEAAARLADRVGQRQQLEDRLADDNKQIAVLNVVATELRADHFLEFVVQETLDLLAGHASRELLRISDDRYSLVSETGEFSVVDHVNADEQRSVRTLSGGETFMASLSLALALSRHVSELAGEGLGARLEAVFIDEGFGSLDPETLEEVIDALERLREDDLLVGVISHVPALAERISVGIRVSKDGSRSVVVPTP